MLIECVVDGLMGTYLYTRGVERGVNGVLRGVLIRLLMGWVSGVLIEWYIGRV